MSKFYVEKCITIFIMIKRCSSFLNKDHVSILHACKSRKYKNDYNL